MPAWVNMLLLSSSGPIKTPVGACATAAESMEIGYETIRSGKARIVVVGGYDDFGEEGSYEFAQMKATSSAVKELSMGRTPREACRPCTDTRGGFMEAQGAGKLKIFLTYFIDHCYVSTLSLKTPKQVFFFNVNKLYLKLLFYHTHSIYTIIYKNITFLFHLQHQLLFSQASKF